MLPCGCLAGVYETYDNEIVGLLDARGLACTDPSHQPGATVSRSRAEAVGAAAEERQGPPPSTR